MKPQRIKMRVVLKTGQSFLTWHSADEKFAAEDLTNKFIHKMELVRRLPFVKKKAIFVQGDNIAYMQVSA